MNIPFRISDREKKFLVYGGVIVLLIILFHVYTWYGSLRTEVEEVSDTRLLTLEKQLTKIAGKGYLQKKVDALKAELKKKETYFLDGDKPPVAAAELQKLLKEKARSIDIEVKLERTLNPVGAGYYLGIPVEIGFTTSTEKFKELLIELRKSPLILAVSEIKIRVTNIRKPEDIYTTLVVTGFIEKPEPGEEREDKNAA